MQFHYFIDIQLRQFIHRHSQIYYKEMGTLGQQIYYQQNSIVTFSRPWKMGNKIHCYVVPFPHWYL